jgi:hypothetical protein
MKVKNIVSVPKPASRNLSRDLRNIQRERVAVCKLGGRERSLRYQAKLLRVFSRLWQDSNLAGEF